jgi:hypothetical protein
MTGRRNDSSAKKTIFRKMTGEIDAAAARVADEAPALPTRSPILSRITELAALGGGTVHISAVESNHSVKYGKSRYGAPPTQTVCAPQCQHALVLTGRRACMVLRCRCALGALGAQSMCLRQICNA